MIAFLLALALQQTETMKVRPSTEAEAVAEFEATCVAGLHDPMQLERAVAASPRGYRDAPESGIHEWQNWISPRGTIHSLRNLRQGPDFSPRCNLTSFTRKPVDRGVLDAALRDMAKRRGGKGYRESRDRGGRWWSWPDTEGRAVKAQAVLDPRTPQQIVLTLQPLALARR